METTEPGSEERRLKILKEYSILDTLPEKEYDEITYLASEICDVPISLISLVDKERQWFKSHLGLSVVETPRDVSFCAQAIRDKHNIMVVPDSRQDDRFKDNPLVIGDPNIVFYAGVPLISSEGEPMGTLCVIDSEARELNDKQIKALKILSGQVMKLLELRRKSKQLERNVEELQNHNKALEKFSQVAAHDIKSPLNNIIMLTKILENDYFQDKSTDAYDLLHHIQRSSAKLNSLIDGILRYSQNNRLLSEEREFVDIRLILEQIIPLVDSQGLAEFNLESEEKVRLYTNKVALEQILLNLLTNSIKYNDKEVPKITIRISETGDYIVLNIIDNGPGIRKEDKDRIFQIFETASRNDNNGRRGMGIGLATVKSLLDGLDGNIKVRSRSGQGANFEIQLPKDV